MLGLWRPGSDSALVVIYTISAFLHRGWPELDHGVDHDGSRLHGLGIDCQEQSVKRGFIAT